MGSHTRLKESTERSLVGTELMPFDCLTLVFVGMVKFCYYRKLTDAPSMLDLGVGCLKCQGSSKASLSSVATSVSYEILWAFAGRS